MQLLETTKESYIGQADPFILESNGKYYIYTTGTDGIYAYFSDDLFSNWKFHGKVFSMPDSCEYWAPSLIELDGKYYMYNSVVCKDALPDDHEHLGAMFVSESDNPLGPFVNPKEILPAFSIDSHIVQNESGLFLFYSTNKYNGKKPGTCIVVDKMLDPYTPQGKPVLVVEPTLDEEIFQKDRYENGKDWHTIEGAHYFREGEWQYVMYSGNCYLQPTYYIGYARAKTDETDLTKIKFKKYPDDNTWLPVIKSNEWEEGTGHHSLIKKDNIWYAIYHARNVHEDGFEGDRRNARICRLDVNDGIITAERFKDKI